VSAYNSTALKGDFFLNTDKRCPNLHWGEERKLPLPGVGRRTLQNPFHPGNPDGRRV